MEERCDLRAARLPVRLPARLLPGSSRLNDLNAVAVSAIFHCQYSSSFSFSAADAAAVETESVEERSQTAFTHCGAIIESQMVFCQLKEEATDRPSQQLASLSSSPSFLPSRPRPL